MRLAESHCKSETCPASWGLTALMLCQGVGLERVSPSDVIQAFYGQVKPVLVLECAKESLLGSTDLVNGNTVGWSCAW